MIRTIRPIVATAVAAAIAVLLPLLAAVPADAAMPGPYVGAYVQPQTGWAMDDIKYAVTNFETQIGRKISIDHHYYGWTHELPGWKVNWDLNNGRIPMVSLATDVRTINSGSQDAWISKQAYAMAKVGRTVLFRFLWEMDITKDLSRDPATFIAAWRKLRTMYVNRGATNVKWVWCPTAYGFATGAAQKWYPGDAHVDWICADGYNWGDATNGQWRSFKDVFAKFYAWASARPKPLLVGETGSQEGKQYWKAEWIKNILPALQSYPRIRALVYFHSKTTSYGGGDKLFEWRVNSSWGAQNAFKNLANSSHFVR